MTDLDRLEARGADWPCRHGPVMCGPCWAASPFPALIAVARDAMGLAYVCAATDRDEPCWECWQCRAHAHQTVLAAKLREVLGD